MISHDRRTRVFSRDWLWLNYLFFNFLIIELYRQPRAVAAAAPHLPRRKNRGTRLGLFNTIHAKFVELGHGFHGAPINDFKYHLDQARWLYIEPILMGKVVVSNTCSEVRLFICYISSYDCIYFSHIMIPILKERIYLNVHVYFYYSFCTRVTGVRYRAKC